MNPYKELIYMILNKNENSFQNESLSSSQTLKLLHFSDLHLWRLGWDRDFTFKRILGILNLLLRRARKFKRHIAIQVLDRLHEYPADALIFSGDLSTTSLCAEFQDASELFKPLAEKFGDRFIAIPGNHDRYTPRAVQYPRFETDFKWGQKSFPFAIELNNLWTLIGFDASVPRYWTSRGKLDSEQFSHLEALFQHYKDRCLIAVGHYPLVWPKSHPMPKAHQLQDHERILELLVKYGVRLYLHGHVHRNWALLDDYGILHVNAGSASCINKTHRPEFSEITLVDSQIHSVVAHHFSSTNTWQMNTIYQS